MLNKGQVMSNYFRLMNKTGGYTWMQSCATLICSSKNSEEQSIICVNYVLRCVVISSYTSKDHIVMFLCSGTQYANLVMDSNQMEDEKVVIKNESNTDFSSFEKPAKKSRTGIKSHFVNLAQILKRSFCKDDGTNGLKQKEEKQLPKVDQSQQDFGTEHPDRLANSNSSMTNQTNREW